MKWYWIVALICLMIAPFDAFYLHIKAEKRRDALKRKKKDAKIDGQRDENDP